MPGACAPTQGQCIADLYDENGQFYRSAVCADAHDHESAKLYCLLRNRSVVIMCGNTYWPVEANHVENVADAINLGWCLTPQEYTVACLMLAGV